MYAIVLATGVEGEANVYRASLMILFAAVFDMLDGRVARMTGRGTDFGIQLDSLADMVSFGIAPAVLLYAWGIHSLVLWVWLEPLSLRCAVLFGSRASTVVLMAPRMSTLKV